jgi:serine/threonine protein kinase
VTPDDWRRVQAVFDAALQRAPDERDAFLDRECAGAPWLRAEVASLLEAHDRAGGFIEAPAFETAAELFVDGPGDSLAGRVIGPYIIRQEIGRGGMGVVYLAEDRRLSRRVALKALAPGVGRDPARRDRLRREARAAAALSHQGIATVYALEEIGDELCLASEYVPGPTLRALIEQGPLPLAEVVDIAVDVARALGAAHAQGIVHRDLKPENAIRTPAGAVKVLDFGIARTENLAPARLTEDGTRLGTPACMAPEQARGLDVDFRTDLFAFGVLVYELASGANPFDGGTPAATIARILEVDPAPLSAVCPSAPPALGRIVAVCLRKAPHERYSSTQRLVADLERLQAELSADDAPGRGGQWPETAGGRRRPWVLTPRWWWEFHQATVSIVYVAAIYPAWHVRPWLPAPWGMLFLFVVLACAATATSLRLHLWFTARFYPAELATQRARARPWTKASDAGFAVGFLLASLAIGDDHPEVAALLVTVASAAAVAAFLIEPTTTRAAFREAPPAP